MVTFSGSGIPSWESFIFQFERVANRRGWRSRKKIERLLDSLTDNALEYTRKLDIEDYHTLKKKLRQQFSKKPQPVTARRQIQYIRQQENESLEDFAHKVYSLAMDGYDRCEMDTLEDIATEAFLRGCKEKDAAIKAMEKNPTSLSKAVKYVKTSLANQKAIFGGTKQSYSKRQVTFSDTEEVLPNQPSGHASSLEQEIKNLSSLVGQLSNSIETNTKEKIERQRSPSPRFMSPTTPYVGFTPNYRRSPTPDNPRDVNLRPSWQSPNKSQLSPNKNYGQYGGQYANRYGSNQQYRSQNRMQYPDQGQRRQDTYRGYNSPQFSSQYQSPNRGYTPPRQARPQSQYNSSWRSPEKNMFKLGDRQQSTSPEPSSTRSQQNSPIMQRKETLNKTGSG